MKITLRAFVSLGILTAAAVCAQAQGRAGGGRGAQTPQAGAPVDLTGYWVSIVTEDWRWRMMTPGKGDYPSIPLSPEGRKVADAWDPAKDEQSGDQCKSYGPGNFVRVPGRLHITWQDANVLKLELDNGQQTRSVRFGRTPFRPAGAATLQGDAWAQWLQAGGRGATGPEGEGGTLKVVTTNFKPHYMQKNGVPISLEATVTEHFDLLKPEPNGDQWLVVTQLIEDPIYLARPFQRSTHYRKERDGSKWAPEPCSAR
ncbi:MAG: hypothetical protein ABL995_16505 [Bryobacteraceae bacterium]